ncbi:MAG: hypothetical protein KDK53_17190 [Maritimibacter sp.]|nr:hypothetical protein [Maritimibacter sp.]
MTRAGDGGVVLARGPVRFDVSAETFLPPALAGRIAHQVRQDLWRALRRLRGFAPVVAVTPRADGLRVVAGGAVAGAIPPGTAARIAAVLDHPGNRARWIAHARRGLR